MIWIDRLPRHYQPITPLYGMKNHHHSNWLSGLAPEFFLWEHLILLQVFLQYRFL